MKRPQLRTILVPVDGSPGAEHALPYALSLARRTGTEVALVGVYSTVQAANDPERLGWQDGEYRVEPLRDYLDAIAERVAKVSPVRVRPVLVKGLSPEDALCEFGDGDADLVVMASRRRGWWSRLWHGSVSAAVARRSRSPVLLVPAGVQPTDLMADLPLGQVLIPLDGTAEAERVLGPAAALAAISNGVCDLLHVVRSRPYAVDWSLVYGGRPTGTSAEQSRTVHRNLHRVAEGLRRRGVSVRWHAVTDQRPKEEVITRYAETSGANVIAMASRGRDGLAGLFRGSLAARVNRLTPLPMLVCRKT
jgi:nucleotide-binding universal stress UspA family protein